MSALIAADGPRERLKRHVKSLSTSVLSPVSVSSPPAPTSPLSPAVDDILRGTQLATAAAQAFLPALDLARSGSEETKLPLSVPAPSLMRRKPLLCLVLTARFQRLRPRLGCASSRNPIWTSSTLSKLELATSASVFWSPTFLNLAELCSSTHKQPRRATLCMPLFSLWF